MAGSAIVKELKNQEHNSILSAIEMTLTCQNKSMFLSFSKNNQIDEVYLAAAKVGGYCKLVFSC